MTWKQFSPYGPAVYRYGPFTLRPLIPPVRGDTGTHTLSVLWVFLCRGERSERSIGQLQRLTPSVQEVLAYIADWIEQKERSVATLERILSRNRGEPTSGEGAENGQDEPEYDEAALQFYRERLDWLRPLTIEIKSQYEHLRDIVARAEPITNASSNLVGRSIDPQTLPSETFDTLSTKHILEIPAFGQMHQVTSAESLLGDEIAQYGRFHILRHLGYRIVGRPYLYTDNEPGLWLPSKEEEHRHAFSLQLAMPDGKSGVLFEGWSEGGVFELDDLLAFLDEWLAQQNQRRRARLWATVQGQLSDGIEQEAQQKSPAEQFQDTLYQEALLARKEVARD